MKEVIQKILDLIEYHYGDCQCDCDKHCNYCKLLQDIQKIEYSEEVRRQFLDN